MDRETRDRFASGTDQKNLNAGNACWETAPKIFKKLQEDFGPFAIDLTANESNHLLPAWFGPGSPLTQGQDALAAMWNEHGHSGFSNSPYGYFISRILPKAKQEAKEGFTSLFLLPLRVTQVFQKHVLIGASDLLFCDKRLTFFENGRPRCSRNKLGRLGATPAMFDSILVVYKPGSPAKGMPRLSLWEVPEHVGSLEQYYTKEFINGTAVALGSD